eukprot:TRINITY_DN9946_c0_g1_i1.p1 TRINITY_DN9946_c0_g1~~TRINITY_DN9946_c0_g1_i1.p1  ORF type:complete len:221 (-),score=20.22 TRINITY_DN9946_c0_g1_i1:81-743(-)
MLFRDFHIVQLPSCQNNTCSFKDLYQTHFLESTEKKLFFKSHYARSYGEGMDGAMNNRDHLIGYCYRGEKDLLLEYFKTETTDKNDILSQLNTKTYYSYWIYFGNYSATHHACIRFGAPYHGEALTPWELRRTDITESPKKIFFPSIESDHARVKEPMPETCLGTPLHWAAMSGQLEIAKILCEEGCDINAKVTEYDATAEEIARTNGHFKLSKYLASLQ